MDLANKCWIIFVRLQQLVPMRTTHMQQILCRSKRARMATRAGQPTRMGKAIFRMGKSKDFILFKKL